MATVFMKVLERWPGTYRRGVAWLTAGRLGGLHRELAARWVRTGDRVLDLGCGDGRLAELCAARGARVVGLDASPAMLEEAHRRLQERNLDADVELVEGDAADLPALLEGRQFDLVVASLLLSEMPDVQVRRVLQVAHQLLAEGGRLVVVDEVVPTSAPARVAYWLIRVPLSLTTWLLARSTTYPLRGLPGLLREEGWQVAREERLLGGALTLILARPAREFADETVAEVPPLPVSRGLADALKRIYCLLMRMVPPYPSVRPGLYRLGTPGTESPVLVTGNYYLTVRRLAGGAEGVDAWVLVADSNGVNVWCGAGGGHFTAEKIAAVVRETDVASRVSHRRLTLPQLCANGVKGQHVEELTGWQVQWGPAYARDIPAYLARGCGKTDAMRQVKFRLGQRLEMAVVMWQFYALLAIIVLAFLSPGLILPGLAISLGLFLFLGLTWPWWPTRNGLIQGLGLAALCLLALGGIWLARPGIGVQTLVNWGIGLVAVALFVGADYQGASPLMRAGEAEHFALLFPVELVLLALYLALRHVAL